MLKPTSIYPIGTTNMGNVPGNITRFNDLIYVVDYHTFAVSCWRNSMLEDPPLVKKGATVVIVDFHTDFGPPDQNRSLFPPLEEVASSWFGDKIERFNNDLKWTCPIKQEADKFILPEIYLETIDSTVLCVVPYETKNKTITLYLNHFEVGEDKHKSRFLAAHDEPPNGDYVTATLRFVTIDELNSLLKDKDPSKIILTPDSDYFSFLLGLYTGGSCRVTSFIPRKPIQQPRRVSAYNAKLSRIPPRTSTAAIEEVNKDFADSLEFTPGAIILPTSPGHIPGRFRHNYWLNSLVNELNVKYCGGQRERVREKILEPAWLRSVEN